MEAKKDINEIKKRLQKQFDEMMGAKEGSLLYPAKLKYQETLRRVAKDIKPWGVFFDDVKATCNETASTINEHYKIEPDTKKFTLWLCDYVDWQIYEKGISLAEIDIETALIDYAKKRKKDIEDKINVGVMFGLDGDPENDDKMLAFIFRELQNNWFSGKENHFIAIFKPERLPQGWQPIEYIKSSKSALGTLIKELAPKVGNGNVWNGFFTHKGKKFDIPTNNRDSESTKQKIKGLKTKYKTQ